MGSELGIRNAAVAGNKAGITVSPRSVRRTVQMRAYAVRFDDSIIDLVVLDLSYDGCSVKTATKLIPGELLKLSVLGRGVVNATVRWYKHRRAGLLFDPERRAHWHRERAAERLEIAAEIFLRRSGKGAYQVRTLDLTRFGCSCEFVERPAIDDRVCVKFAGLEALGGEVRWIAGSSLGLKFDKPIHPAVFELLLQRIQID